MVWRAYIEFLPDGIPKVDVVIDIEDKNTVIFIHDTISAGLMP